MKTRTKLLSRCSSAPPCSSPVRLLRRQSASTPAPKDTSAPLRPLRPPLPAQPRGYPDSVITMIVNYSAGGGTDLSARAFGDAIAKALNGNITVTNLPGGTGSLGVTELANSKADGYTIGVATLAPLALVPYQLDVTYTPDSFQVSLRLRPVRLRHRGGQDSPIRPWMT